MTVEIHSYSEVFALSHRAAADILSGPVTVQEKIDGSQFSFMLSANGDGVVLRSKGAQIHLPTEDKLFKPAVETVLRLWNEKKLQSGHVYRGEILSKPKHNVLAYDRVPVGNVILFDIDTGLENYAPPEWVREQAEQMGLETVPTLYEGAITSLDQVRAFLDRVSVLGGSTIEGVVLKAYGRYGRDKKTLMAKYVSEKFKEVHATEWRKSNPTRQDIILRLIETYRTPARWQKAVQHLREAGTLQEAPQDIGPLMKEVGVDVLKEEREAIMADLFAYAWPQIQRGITAGLPQWYKDELAKSAFAPTEAA